MKWMPLNVTKELQFKPNTLDSVTNEDNFLITQIIEIPIFHKRFGFLTRDMLWYLMIYYVLAFNDNYAVTYVGEVRPTGK